MSAEQVHVLQLLEFLASALPLRGYREDGGKVTQAHAAVAELRAASAQMLESFEGWGTTDSPACSRLRAALARVQP